MFQRLWDVLRKGEGRVMEDIGSKRIHNFYFGIGTIWNHGGNVAGAVIGILLLIQGGDSPLDLIPLRLSLFRPTCCGRFLSSDTFEPTTIVHLVEHKTSGVEVGFTPREIRAYIIDGAGTQKQTTGHSTPQPLEAVCKCCKSTQP